MSIILNVFPYNQTITCNSAAPTGCKTLGYTTKIQPQQGDISYAQTTSTGAITGLTLTGNCPACSNTLTATFTTAQLTSEMAGINPNVIDPAIKDTIAGVTWVPPGQQPG
jgi:hypothetical protein